MPALAAFSLHEGQILEAAAVGLRAIGHGEEVTVDDRWHLGSLTKAMTSTLAAVLVEDGLITWDATVAEVFPALAVRPEYRTVRLDDLLSHTGGVHTDITRAPSWSRLGASPDPLPVQRRLLVSELLNLDSDATRGMYAYSNGGYVVAGAMLEQMTGEDWEGLITRRLFSPLGMASTGFGAPGSPGAPDQPWGHATVDRSLTALEPGPGADNPAAIGPAGTVHSTFPSIRRPPVSRRGPAEDRRGPLCPHRAVPGGPASRSRPHRRPQLPTPPLIDYELACSGHIRPGGVARASSTSRNSRIAVLLGVDGA
jgi:CubicO group peptidase (beta-lactamase class C family)